MISLDRIGMLKADSYSILKALYAIQACLTSVELSSFFTSIEVLKSGQISKRLSNSFFGIDWGIKNANNVRMEKFSTTFSMCLDSKIISLLDNEIKILTRFYQKL